MDVTIINSENRAYFQSFLLPDVYALLEKGLPISAIGLVDHDTACGALAGYQEDSTFRIASFFIAPSYRNKGGGALLLQTIKQVLKTIPSLTVLQVRYTVTREDHEALHSFLHHMGFKDVTPEETIYSVALSDLQHVSFLNPKRLNAYPPELMPFSKIPDILIKQLDRAMLVEDGRPLAEPLEQSSIDKDISIGYVVQKKIAAYLLFDHSFDGQLTLAYANSGTSNNAPELFSVMLRQAFQLALAKYSPETKLVIQAVTPLAASLVQRIAGECDTFQVLSYIAEQSLVDLSEYSPLLQV